MVSVFRILSVLSLSVLIFCGCETHSDINEADLNQPNTASPAASPSVSSDSDSEWDSIEWHTYSGPSGAGATKVMELSATMSGNHVHFTFNRYPWGKSMGLCHFFVKDGDHWRGGKMDWIRAGGQSAKGLENIHRRYNQLRAPASGTEVAWAWTSANGKERSNLAKTRWP